MSVLAVPH